MLVFWPLCGLQMCHRLKKGHGGVLRGVWPDQELYFSYFHVGRLTLTKIIKYKLIIKLIAQMRANPQDIYKPNNP
jgi:hypothetical protein